MHDMLEQIDAIFRNRHQPESRESRLAQRKLRELQTAAASKFASLNGWQTTRREFSLETLRDHKMHGGWGGNWGRGQQLPHEFFDHREFFRDREKPYRAAAIVAHNYPNRETNDEQAAAEHAFAAEHGLVAHHPPRPRASWYYPGSARLVCYTRPGVAVTWLPGRP
jgi:hypothetical protein